MWSAYLLMFYLNLDGINHLVRVLQDNPGLRQICELPRMPDRSTFGRAFRRIADHLDLVEVASANLVASLNERLPELGCEVAVDSTTVPTFSNPNRESDKRATEKSDPEAGWTKKNAARAKGGKEWHWGYKLHAVVDANYGIPLTFITTAANRNDGKLLRPLVEKTEAYHNIRPEVVIADKGYDSKALHEWLVGEGITPIIGMRRTTAKDGLYDGNYDKNGAPVCMGKQTMEYVLTADDSDLYICPDEGCRLHAKSSGAMTYCDFAVWEPLDRNYRLRGPVRRGTDEWSELYEKRQSVERVFKSLKQSRKLNRHYFRGLRKISLHCAVSVLMFQATVLVKVLAGKQDDLLWQVKRM